MIGIAGPELDDATKRLLDDVSPGGVCLFARNIREVEQTRELLDGLREYLPAPPLLSVDQEGGLVDRLRRVVTPMPAAAKMRGVEDAARLGAIAGEALSILGFNMDLAPVVDVMDEARARFQNGLVTRTFGSSPEDVLAFAGAFLGELQSHGIAGCLKHFPGLAASRVDSHEELPLVDIEEDEFEARDLVPYLEWRSMNGLMPAVMVAHAAFPGHTLQQTDQNGKLLPSSLSYNFVTTLLRGRIGFDGLVISDDLEMGAIINNYGIGEASKMAINAGVDMIAICAGEEAIRQGHRTVLDAVRRGEIKSERLTDALRHIQTAKMSIQQPRPFDKERLEQLSAEIAAFNAELGN